MSPTRRDFLRTAAVAAASPGVAVAIDPIRRPGPVADLKLSLAAYSFRQFLDVKKGSMTLFDFIDFAADLPLDAVELTSYYFADTSDAYLAKLREHAERRRRPISGVPIRSEFTLRDDTARAREVQHAKDWTARAARLGARTVRIFAGNLGKNDTLADAQRRVVDCLNECCPVAERLGGQLALENHGGITDTAEHLLDLVRPVRSQALGVNIDTGNFRTADPYREIAAIVPYGVVAQVKTEMFPNGRREDADLARVVRILKDGNFHGYVALEYEAAEDPKVAVPRVVRELRRLIG
ncbi:sugar phosphate isomerase/epimerase [bacterium]|nr:sugar phosphate isomerase/epimerase [bacterium]